MQSSYGSDLALVMSGGGARAAYQVGFLRHLARQFPDLHVPIVTGTSAGAINAAHLASHNGSFEEAVQELYDIWCCVTTDRIFRVDSASLFKHMLQWGARLILGGAPGTPHVRGMVDTEPLRQFLGRHLRAEHGRIHRIEGNVWEGRLKALAIVTTNYATGQTIIWTQGSDLPSWERPNRRSIRSAITIDHIMASTALPFIFPAVRLGNAWYGDGGIRMTAPLSPALHLGAERIIAITTRYGRSDEEADELLVPGYPPPAQIAGILMNAVFLDTLDQDASILRRTNRLLEKLPPEEHGDLRIARLLMLRPSVDLGKLSRSYEPELPALFRFLMRGLGTRETVSPDWLSMLLFEPEYLQHLMEIGEADAEARQDEIRAFLEGEPDHDVKA